MGVKGQEVAARKHSNNLFGERCYGHGFSNRSWARDLCVRHGIHYHSLEN